MERPQAATSEAIRLCSSEGRGLTARAQGAAAAALLRHWGRTGRHRCCPDCTAAVRAAAAASPLRCALRLLRNTCQHGPARHRTPYQNVSGLSPLQQPMRQPCPRWGRPQPMRSVQYSPQRLADFSKGRPLRRRLRPAPLHELQVGLQPLWRAAPKAGQLSRRWDRQPPPSRDKLDQLPGVLPLPGDLPGQRLLQQVARACN